MQKAISFTMDMAKAIQEGRKTQTRRIIKGAPMDDIKALHEKNEAYLLEVSKIKTGDELWVRETHSVFYEEKHKMFYVTYKDGHRRGFPSSQLPDKVVAGLLARKTLNTGRYVSGRFMPKAFANTTLSVTNDRVEELLDISEEDAMAEGVLSCFSTLFQETRYMDYTNGDPRGWRTADMSFFSLWKSVHKLECELNEIPNELVYVYEFKVKETY